MNEGFHGHLRTIVEAAKAIATSRGSTTVEAEHLLLAVIEHPSERLGDGLRTLWLTAESVGHALDEEVEDALAAVGVRAPRFVPTAPRSGRLGWGQSAKLAWIRAHRTATERGVKRLDDRHLLIGITRAEAGAIPRVLDRLGLTRAAVEQAVR